MKHVLFMIVMFVVFSITSIKAQVFNENFEGTSNNMTSSTTGIGAWGINSRLFSQGIKSDSAAVTQGDTTYLTVTNSFSTIGKFAIYLDFDHICKISLFDSAFIEVSNNNGISWQRVKGVEHYLGTALYASLGDRFTELSYNLDWGGVSLVTPEQSWWKAESFDISNLAANSADVKIRFVLIDGLNDGAAGRNGWFLDNITVTSSISELVPPIISLTSPNNNVTLSQSSPYLISANIFDASGIDTAYIAFSANGGIIDTVPMMATAVTDSFVGSIPFQGFGRTVEYQIYAKDQSLANNLGVGPISGTYKLNTVYVPGMASVTYSEGFESGIPSSWIQETNDLMDWSPNAGTGNSSYTGPSAAYEGTHYMYIEATSNFNKNAIITTNAYDLSTTQNAMMTFRYHMFGADMGDLKIHLYSNGTWTNDVLVISGQQQNSETAPWLKAEIDLSMYQTADFKFRLESLTLGDYRSDICVDDFKIGPAVTLTTDAGISEITSPTIGTLNNVAFDVKVRLNNFGNDTLVTANINWALDGNAQDTTAYSGQLLFGNDSIVNLGSLTLAGGSYTISSWTDIPNNTLDQNLLNDTSTYSFFVCNSVLSGIYTIDPAGSGPNNFASFNEAELALMQCGINGPVIFNVASGTYNENINLTAINGSSATNTIIFQSANGDSSSVILEYNATDETDNYVVNLDGTSNISFKGMTIQALDNSFARVFVLGNSSENIAFNNNVIKAPRTSVDNSNMALILGVGFTGNDIEITNNMFIGANYSVNLFADSIGENWNINNNTFDQVHNSAITLFRAKSVSIIKNIIIGDTAGCATNFHGIFLTQNTGTASIIKNSVLTTNSNIVNGIRLTSCNFDSLNHTSIINNFIQIEAQSTVNSLSTGILNHQSNNVDIYYNTVRLSGLHTISAAIALFDATAGASKYINIVNNIFTNQANGFIYYVNNVDTSLWLDHHNVLYNYEGTNPYSFYNTNIASFNDWITVSGTTNTYSIDPYFISDTDLHVSNNLLNAFGTPIIGINTDYDGDSRDAVSPDNGADEFTPSPFDIIAMEIINPIGTCGMTSTESVTVRYRNIGTATITTFNAYYQVTGNATSVNETVTTPIAAGDTLDYTFTSTVDLDVNTSAIDSTFGFTAWAVLTGDQVQVNDTTFSFVNSGYVPANIYVANDTISYGTIDTLYATGNNVYWWASNTDSIELRVDTAFITPNLYNNTTYWVNDGPENALKLTETVQFKTAPSATNPYPSYLPTTDFDGVEISNLGSKVNMGGYTINVSNGSNFYSYTFPLNTVLEPGEVILAIYGAGLTVGPSGNNVYVINSYTPIGSYSAVAYYLQAPDGSIVDAFSSNNAPFPANSGVNPSDFIGAFGYNYNAAGHVRIISDNNHINDWAYVTAGSFGSLNTELSDISANGCFGVRQPVTVIIDNVPTIDACITTILSPIDTILGNTDYNLTVDIYNYGTSPLTSLDITYSLDDIITDTIHWTGSIAYQNSLNVTLDIINVTGGLYDLKVWSHNPNNFADTINTNDTVSMSFAAQLNGNYTIGVGPTFDYPDLSSAVNALIGGGVYGPCTFGIDTGLFIGQVVIPEISGVSATNNIIFQSLNGDSSLTILEFSSTLPNENYVIKLDGADYITFQKLTMRSAGTSSYQGVIQIANKSTHNNFYNNTVVSKEGSLSTYAKCIYSNYDNDDYTNIINNHIMYGFYGIYLKGVSNNAANNEKGTVINNNFIDSYNKYGIYIYNQDSIIIRGNNLTTCSTTTIDYPIYAYYCNEGFDISNNTSVSRSSTNSLGMRVYNSIGNANERGLFSNNMISVIGGTGINYGLYIYNNQFMDIYYNTISIVGGNADSRAAHIYAWGTNHDNNFTNNILRDSIGFTLYIQNGYGINQLNHNNHYSSSANMSFDGVNNLADLAALQASTGKEINSVFLDPMFTSNTDLHLTSATLSGSATSLSEVTHDIDGKLRSTMAPTIGAHEVDVLPIDLATKEILLVPSVTDEATIYPLSAVIKNNGSDTIFGFQVNYTINAGTSVINTFTNTIPPFITDTVTLTPITSPAGDYILCITGVVVGDGNSFNNEVCKNIYGTPIKDALIIDIKSIDETCDMAYDTVMVLVTNIGIDTINGYNQAPTTIKYQSNNNTVVTEPYTTVIAPFDSAWYTFITPVYVGTNNLVDSLYNITAWISFQNDNNPINDSITIEVESPHTPDIPLYTNPFNVTYGTQAVLNATSASNDSILWFFDNDASNSYSRTGNQYTTDWQIMQDTSMWLATRGEVTGIDVTLGNGTLLNTSIGFPTPFANYYFGNKEQYLILASELAAMGINSGPISELSFNVSAINACPTLNNYSVAIGSSSQSNLSNWENGLTPVYNNNAFIPVLGWNSIPFATPYVWDGTSNIVIEICSNNTGWTDNGNAQVNSTSTAHTSTINVHGDNSSVCTMIFISSTYTKRPNIRFVGNGGGCISPLVEFDIQTQMQSACDVSVISTAGIQDHIYLTSNEDITIEVKNLGSNDQAVIPVNYVVNGGTIVTENISVNANSSLIYTFNTKADLSAIGTYDIKLYTDLICDTIAINDTIITSTNHILPDYCISKATSNYGLYIENVKVDNDSNGTTSQFIASYTDYTTLGSFTSIAPDSTYNISLKVGSSYSSNGYIKVYIDFNRDGIFDPVADLAFGAPFSVGSSTSSIINGIITVDSNANIGTTHMRVVAENYGTITSVSPCGTYSQGETEDYVINIAPIIPNDAGIEQILNIPNIVNLASIPLEVRVRNYGSTPITSVDLIYTVNGIPTTYTYTTVIAVGDSADVSLGNISIDPGMNDICVKTVLTGDNNFFNDQKCLTTFKQVMVNLPYCDDFETDDLWMRDNDLSQWELGIPTMTNINTAHSPTNVWAIDLDDQYVNNSSELLFSPKFVITSNIDSALLKFWHYYDTEINTTNSDGGYIQYRKNSGLWLALGYIGDTRATAWYNDATGGTNKFSGNSNGWVESTYNLDFTTGEFANTDTIQFRLNFYSNSYTNSFDGWAIDDFCLELPLASNDIGVVEVTNPITTAQIGSPITVTVDIANFGSISQSSFDVWYQVGSEAVVTETFTPTGGLVSFDTISYTFATQAIALSTDFIVCSGTSLTSDTYTQNNDACSGLINVTAANIDAGVTAIGKIQEYGGNDTTSYLTPVILKAEITNFGINTLTSIVVEYTIGGAQSIPETWTGSIATGEVDTIVFATPFQSPPGNYSICVRTVVPNDANVDNDELCNPYIGSSLEDADGIIFEVSQNEPNPAVGNVRINYIVPSNGDINFELRNTLGQVIYTTEQASFTGKNTIEVDANSLANGVYYYSVIFDGQRITRKMIVNK